MHISIIGAGPAGLMTAITILEQLPAIGSSDEIRLHIFEKNKSPGNKLLISGGGRCNVTTGITDKKILATKYTRGWDWIKKSIGKFGPKKTYEWFEAHGVPLKMQNDMRAFPVSDDGHDILSVFERAFERQRASISLHYSEGVSSITRDGDTFHLTTHVGSYESDIVVITTGGNAYSHTGSTGDGYAFARSLGHTISPLGPSLSSFVTSESWMYELSGLSFEDARIQYHPPHNQGELCTLTGPLLLTHFGISGPLAFMTSSHLAHDPIGGGSTRCISFSPIAEMRYTDWDDFLRAEFRDHPKKLITSILVDRLPRRLVEALIEEYFSSIREVFVGSISRQDRENISALLGRGIPITLTERRAGDEFVTAGGVVTDEIDPETMESHIQKHLYFAGEILDVDGYTGGFSLQICWSSGYTAGRAIIEHIKNK